ncbi:LPS export ABC transporter permease LptG [Gammaproteobacteria bacterium]|nr:LPS export ABC transporter permease LptG [Gammaproteobacteria bacterium]
MNIISRYIAKHVISSTIIVLFVVMALSFIIGMLHELRGVGEGDYGIFQVFIHEILMLPRSVYSFFPMLVLLGGVIGLGTLVSSNELMIIRSLGVSVKKIVISVILASILLISLATVLGELVAPRSNFIAEKQKSIAQTVGQAMVTTSGIWVHEGNDFIHINRVVGHNRFKGVTKYEFDQNHKMLATYFADALDFNKGHWYAYDLNKTILGKDKAISSHSDIVEWNLKITPNLLKVGFSDSDSMSLRKLYQYSNYLAKNKLESGAFKLAFWQRVFQPLTTLVMILLSIPFVFVAPRSVAMSKRILVAIILSFSFYLLNAFFGQFSIVYQYTPVLSALLPTTLFLLISVIWIWKNKVY